MKGGAKVVVAGSGGVLAVAVLGVMRGNVTLDTGIGRRTRPLGPRLISIAAPCDVAFDVVARPYLERTPRALSHKLHVLERGSDMALAAHHTATRWFTATTVETVRFQRPHRIHFRLLRGPVPHVTETFAFTATSAGCDLEYTGELGTDFWRLGEWWASVVARRWEAVVTESLKSIRAEAERRAR